MCSAHYARWRRHGDPNIATTRKTPADRFWAKVDRRTDDECWEWQANRHQQGYGLFSLDTQHGSYKAHRFSWELANGQIPDGSVVRHRCDNPPCVNPAHLELGSQADNMADMRGRGRERKAAGATHPRARLTDEQIAEIRSRYRFRVVTAQMLADEYGVSVSFVRHVLSGDRLRKGLT